MQSWKMRAGMVVTLGVAVLAALGGSPTVMSQTERAPMASSQDPLQVVSTLLPTGVQQLVVVDSLQHSMAVYHIEPGQGKIQLRSVRRMQWDLRMEQFNAEAPFPSELREVQP